MEFNTIFLIIFKYLFMSFCQATDLVNKICFLIVSRDLSLARLCEKELVLANIIIITFIRDSRLNNI